MNAIDIARAPTMRPDSNRARALVVLLGGAAHIDVIGRRAELTPEQTSSAVCDLRARGLIEGRHGTYRLTLSGAAAANALVVHVDDAPMPPEPDDDEDDHGATVAALRVLRHALGRGRFSRAELADVADRSDRTLRRLLHHIRAAGYRVTISRHGVQIDQGGA